MNNEPVAWRNLLADEEDQDGTWFYNEVGQGIPLYTHPVKEDEGKVCARCGAIAYDPVITQTLKELTDEEIFAIAIPTEIDGTDEEVLTFARAILRKAQEK